MLDSHCHVDLYPDPSAVATRAEAAGVFTILVTNLPSVYEKLRPHIVHHKRIRLALGLHPLLAVQHAGERDRFRELVNQASFIGEIGLDFSAEGKKTADMQIESFAFILRVLAQQPKFITVHSRRAETQVVKLLREGKRSPVVFHWYIGSLKALNDAIADGHYFSINPAMLRSRSGREIVAAIPRDRILTETDGPFVRIGRRAAEPVDVEIVENGLGRIWNTTSSEVRSTVVQNFNRLIAPLRAMQSNSNDEK